MRELSALPAARCPLDLSTGGRTVVCRGCRGCNCATRPQLVACTCRRRTDGRNLVGVVHCRWSSEDSRGFARIGKAKSRTRYGFAAAGRRQTPAGAHSRVSPSHLPPATASHLPRPCCTTREVPYSTPSEREGHSSGTESLADCSFTTSPSSMVLEASMLLEHVPQPTYPTHCT